MTPASLRSDPKIPYSHPSSIALFPCCLAGNYLGNGCRRNASDRLSAVKLSEVLVSGSRLSDTKEPEKLRCTVSVARGRDSLCNKGMFELFSFELLWPEGGLASGNPGVMMLSSTRSDQAIREAKDVWEGQRHGSVPPPVGYRIRATAGAELVHEHRVDNA